MSDVRVTTPIHRCDDVMQHFKKLQDYNSAEEVLGIVPFHLKNQKEDVAQLHKNTEECKPMKCCLETSHGEVTKSWVKCEDSVNHEPTVSKNDHSESEKFFNSTNFQKIRGESREKLNVVLKSENDNPENDREALKLHILVLNSDLKITQNLLDEERSQRERIERERKNLEYLSEKLCSLLLKYQRRIHQLEEIIETKTRASVADSKYPKIESDSKLILKTEISTIRDGFDENNFRDVCSYNDKLSILPAVNFQDDNTSPKNINLLKESLNMEQSSPVLLDETASTNTTKSSSPKTSPSIFQSDSETNLYLNFVRELQSINSSKDALDSEILKRKKVVGLNSTILDSSSSCSSLEPVKTNEKPPAQNSNKHMRKLVLPTEKVPSSVTAVKSQFICNTCGKSYLKSFEAEKRGQRLEKCPNCEVCCNTRNSSLKTKKTDNFANDDHIHEELKTRYPANVRCDICGKIYSSKSTLNNHIRQVHKRDKPYHCSTCGKRFAEKYYLKRHTAVHNLDRPFKCSVCNEFFKYSSSKRYHEQVVHEGYAPFHCAHCDRRYTQKCFLISHIFSQHFPGTRKQFKCDICDKSFAIRVQLKRHKLVHTSQRPFKCSICDLRFNRHDNKLRHEKNIHG